MIGGGTFLYIYQGQPASGGPPVTFTGRSARSSSGQRKRPGLPAMATIRAPASRRAAALPAASAPPAHGSGGCRSMTGPGIADATTRRHAPGADHAHAADGAVVPAPAS
jgi:hypothetical protein